MIFFKKITKLMRILSEIAGHSPGEFNYPWDIDISPNGDMIAVSDSRNHRVQIFDRFGNYLKKFTVFEQDPFEYKSKFDYPRGICFDRDGKIFKPKN